MAIKYIVKYCYINANNKRKFNNMQYTKFAKILLKIMTKLTHEKMHAKNA